MRSFPGFRRIFYFILYMLRAKASNKREDCRKKVIPARAFVHSWNSRAALFHRMSSRSRSLNRSRMNRVSSCCGVHMG